MIIFFPALFFAAAAVKVSLSFPSLVAGRPAPKQPNPVLLDFELNRETSATFIPPFRWLVVAL